MSNNITETHNDLIVKHIKSNKGILHLGAHIGQEASQYDAYGKPVIWVEALPHIYEQLKKNISIYPNQQALCALLTDKDNDTKAFHISNNSEGVSSSIFEFGEYANGKETLWPELNLSFVDTLNLTTIKLDTLFSNNNLDMSNYGFWIVDLQGAELLALKGAESLLDHCNAMYIEVSTVEVYQQGVLWDELEEFLKKTGFIPLWKPEKKHDDVLFMRNTAY